MGLTNRQIRAAMKAGKRSELWDDVVTGLHVVVTEAGVATFAVRYRSPSGHRRFRLEKGRFGQMTIEQARDAAADAFAELRAGRDPAKRTPASEHGSLADAVKEYLDAAEHRLRPKTLETYRAALARFTTWAANTRVGTCDALGRTDLAAFRAWLVALPKHTAKRKGKRGERESTARRRSPLAVNRELRAVKTFLLDLRRQGKLPHADREAIADTLRALPAAREQPEFLTPNQIAKLLHACLRHDAATFVETRAEHAGRGEKGTTLRYLPITPFAAVLLLTGMRRGEALGLRWDDVDLDALDHDGHKVGEIRLRAAATKTHRARTIGLEVSPGLRRLLAAMKLRSEDRHRAEPDDSGADETRARVFDGYTEDLVTKARARLMAEYGAPAFDWQELRSTCGTYLTNAPAIFGAAAPFMSAKQLGHSVVVAERHYAGLLRGIPREAQTLDAAMRIEALLVELVDALQARPGTAVVSLADR